MGLLGLPVPGPSDAVRAATGLYAALDQAVALVPRIATLLTRLEQLADRAEGVIDRVDTVVDLAHGTIERVEGVVTSAGAVVGRTTGVVDAASGVVGGAAEVVGGAAGVVDAASGIVDRTGGVVDGAEVVVGRTSGVVDDASGIVRRTAGVVDGADDLLDTGGALVKRIAETTSEEELQAIVHLIDTLPQAVDALRNDVLPVMSTLGTVAPDVRDLLDIASQLNGVLGSVPGLGRLKKRVEKAQADDDAYRADEEPPSSPDRG